jgi:hypothetical protein
MAIILVSGSSNGTKTIVYKDLYSNLFAKDAS